jgi:hypothetical protein
MAIFDSYMYGFKTVGRDGGYCIKLANGPGPYKFTNNYECSSGIGILSGGEVPVITGNIPSDIEFRRNVVTKNDEWNGVFKIKNLFELKNAQRVLVEGNILRDNTYDAAGQSASGIVISGSGDTGTDCYTLRDLTIRHNLIRNVGQGMRIFPNNGTHTLQSQRISVTNNHFDHIDISYCTTASCFILMNGVVQDDPPCENLVIDHNSFLFTSTGYLGAKIYSLTTNAYVGDPFVMTNNIIDANATNPGIFDDGRTQYGEETLTTFTNNRTISKNVIIGIPAQWISDYPTWYPVGDPRYWGHAANHAALNYTNEASHDYTIQAATTFKGFCADGSDPGPNWTTLNAAIANTETGDWA